MEHLDGITVEDLQRALDSVEDKRPAQRLLAAIAYKNGVTQTELAAWHGVRRRTVYRWLTRIDEEPLPDAVTDDRRPGRPRKLGAAQLTAFERAVADPPTASGYDADEWTPALVERFVAERFDVEYSRPSCRRLLREASEGRDG